MIDDIVKVNKILQNRGFHKDVREKISAEIHKLYEPKIKYCKEANNEISLENIKLQDRIKELEKTIDRRELDKKLMIEEVHKRKDKCKELERKIWWITDGWREEANRKLSNKLQKFIDDSEPDYKDMVGHDGDY